MAHLGDWIFVLIVKTVRHICLLNVKLMARNTIRNWLKSTKTEVNYLRISNYQVVKQM